MSPVRTSWKYFTSLPLLLEWLAPARSVRPRDRFLVRVRDLEDVLRLLPEALGLFDGVEIPAGEQRFTSWTPLASTRVTGETPLAEVVRIQNKPFAAP